MKLQTIIPLRPEQQQISYHTKTLLLGSCFVENMGAKLHYYKFQGEVNPFGIIFHPKAIERLVRRAVENAFFSEEDVFFFNGHWQCFEVHSELSDISKAALLNKLNATVKTMRQWLNSSEFIVITLGTAWGYRHLEKNQIVANCHKVPQKEFSKELWGVKSVVDCLNTILKHIGTLNEKANIIFTVSPVRHLKDGFVENQQSKAHLLSAVHEVVNTVANTCYFPSYEIMMDELRDYRFYASDMVHPNELAIDYIWDKFKYVWISPQGYEVMQMVEQIQKGLAHKPFNKDSEQHYAFQKKLQNKIEQLQKQYPEIIF